MLLEECAALNRFWRSHDNLYGRVRALFFFTRSTASIYRIGLRFRLTTLVPFAAVGHLLNAAFRKLSKHCSERNMDWPERRSLERLCGCL